MMTRVALIFLFALTHAEVSAQSIMEMNANACASSDVAGKALNRVYSQILRANAGDKSFVEAFKASQKAWTLFRDANIRAVYPDPDPIHAYGIIHPACLCTLVATMTEERTRELRKRWIIGTDEAEVCAGSSALHPKVQHH